MRPRGSAAWLEERRRKAVRLVEKEGLSQAEVSRRLGVTPAAVSQWRKRCRRQGQKALAARPTPGRPARLGARQRGRLRRLLLQGAKSAGYSTDLWTCPRVQNLIGREFGVRYHVHHLPKLLRAMGFTPQKPTRRALERDEKAIRRWVEKDWPGIKKKPAG